MKADCRPCAIVLDMAENGDTGERYSSWLKLYARPEIHILKNPGDAGLSPWYSTGFEDILDTPEWQFDKDQLYRFKE